MAVKHDQLAKGALTATVATLYTVPTGAKTQIRAVTVTNPTAAPVELSVYLGTDTELLEVKTIAANETYLCMFALNHILKSGDVIAAKGDGLSILISGAEIT